MIGALAAKSYGELERVTAISPGSRGVRGPGPARASGASRPEPPRRRVRWMVARMAGSRRRGRLLLTGQVNLLSIMGGSTIYLLDTVNVEVEGCSLMGGNTELGVGPAAAARRCDGPDQDLQPDGRLHDLAPARTGPRPVP